MLCSHARSQPACFSGRTLPSAPLSSKPLHGKARLALKGMLKVLAAAEQSSAHEEAEAEALRTSAAELRAKLSSFDSRSFNGSQQKEVSPGVETAASAAPFSVPPLARNISSREEILDDSQPLARTDAELMNDIEAFERDKWQDVQSSKPGELFDWALQILEAEQVSGRQLLQLITEMRRALAAADGLQKTAWQSHRAFEAAEASLGDLFETIDDEVLVKLATEFGSIATQRRKPPALPSICEELSRRQQRGLSVTNATLFEFLEMIAALPFMRAVAQVARDMIITIDLDQASSKELQIVLQSLVTIRGQKQLQPQFETAVTLAFERLDDLSADHLYALLIAAGSLENKMPYTKLQRLAELLALKDPDLETAPDLITLLWGCSALGLPHRGLLEAAARALSSRTEAEGSDKVLLALHALANLRPQLSEASKDSLASALKKKFSSAQLEVSSPTVGSFTMLICAMRHLRVSPPRGWVEVASVDIIDRIVHLLMEQRDPNVIESWAITEAASCILCLGYMQPTVQSTGRLFPAIISVLPRSSAYNLAIIARGASKLSSVLHVPRELWETLDAVAASKASEFSDLQFCQVMHSFAKWRIQPQKLKALLSDQVFERVGRLDLHKTSVILWSLAMLSFQSNKAIQALTKRADCLLDLRAFQQGQSHTVDAANIAWAVTTLSLQPSRLGPFVSKLMARARPIQTMTGISIAIMLWACSQSSAKPYKLHLYVARIEEVVQDLEPLQITTILWSLGKLNHHPGIELMEALLSAINLNIGAFATQGVGQAMWACGRLRHHPGVLAGSVLVDLRRRGGEYALEDWTVIVWALTSVGQNTKEFLQLAHHMIEEARLQTDFKLLSTILWSAAVFELFTEPVYKRLTQLLFSYRHLSHDAESVRRVQEAHLLSCLVGSSRPGDLNGAFRMPGGVQQWMAELMSQDLGPQTRHQYRRIREALVRLNIPAISKFQLVAAEATLQGRALRENIMLTRPHGTSRMVAVELLSPNMLTVNTHQPLWRVVYRAACLCALGFDVMWLPYSEWEAALARNVEEEYLLSRISALLSGPESDDAPNSSQAYPLRNKFLV